MAFYQNFLSLCNNIGQPPSTVIEKIGLNRSSVSRWKTGAPPRMSNVYKVAEYFGVDPLALMAEDANIKPHTDLLATEEEKNLLHAYRRSPERVKMYIAGVLAPYGFKKPKRIEADDMP